MPLQRRTVLAGVAALATAGCLGGPGVGVGSILGYEGLQRDLARHYASWAWEKNASCNTPRMTRILRADIIDETQEEIVALIRYSWLDESRIESSRGRTGFPSGRASCRGIDERRFTLRKVDDGVRVVDMSGPKRPRPITA